MTGALEFAPVVLDDGCDIGIGAIILPGVTVGSGAQVGAGAVVTATSRPSPSSPATRRACYARANALVDGAAR